MTTLTIKADIREAELRLESRIETTIAAAKVEIKVKTGVDGKLFGSVTSSDVVDALKKQTGIELSRQQVDMSQHIKDLGEHVVPVRLYKEVRVELKVSVIQE